MAGLVPAIHVFAARKEDVDARMRGHDGARGSITMSIFELLAAYDRIVGVIGGAGLIALAIAFPAAAGVAGNVVAKLLGVVLHYRVSVAALALAAGYFAGDLHGTRDEEMRAALRDAQRQAALTLKLAGAARAAAAQDSARAAAAETARAQAEDRANALAATTPKTACLGAATVHRLRELWHGAARPAVGAARPAAAPRSIDDLLRRK